MEVEASSSTPEHRRGAGRAAGAGPSGLLLLQLGLQHAAFPAQTPIIGTDTTGGADSAGVGFRRASVTRLQNIMRSVYGVEAGGTEPNPLDVLAGNGLGKVTLQLGVNSRLDLSYEYTHSTPDLLFSGCRHEYVVFCLGSTGRTPAAHPCAYRPSDMGGRAGAEALRTTFSSPGPGSGRKLAGPPTFPWSTSMPDAGDLGAGGNSLCVDDLNAQDILELTDNLGLAAGAHHLTAGLHGELDRTPHPLQPRLWLRARLAFRESGLAGGWTSGPLQRGARAPGEAGRPAVGAPDSIAESLPPGPVGRHALAAAHRRAASRRAVRLPPSGEQPSPAGGLWSTTLAPPAVTCSGPPGSGRATTSAVTARRSCAAEWGSSPGAPRTAGSTRSTSTPGWTPFGSTATARTSPGLQPTSNGSRSPVPEAGAGARSPAR